MKATFRPGDIWRVQLIRTNEKAIKEELYVLVEGETLEQAAQLARAAFPGSKLLNVWESLGKGIVINSND